MGKIIESIHKLLQAIMLTIALLIIGCFVFLPDLFGAKAAVIFQTLRDHNIEFSITPDGPELSYTEDEAVKALETQGAVDAVAEKIVCLRDQSCGVEEQQEIAEILSIEPRIVEISEPIDEFDFWIVILSADKTIGGALHEVGLAASSGYNPDLIFVDDWYRTVIPFPSQVEAERELPIIQADLNRSDAYVRSLIRWCSDHERVTGNATYIVCDKNW